jgi:hypothetical protein
LQVVIIKPSKYLADGSVERFRRGFMPNSTVPYLRSMVPAATSGMPIASWLRWNLRNARTSRFTGPPCCLVLTIDDQGPSSETGSEAGSGADAAWRA